MKAQRSRVDFSFGAFELQPQERRLLKGGMAINVGPRAFNVLVCLVERAGHLVSKDELFDRVWPRVVVDDGALQVQISALRKILGSKAIVTVSGSGYRFVMSVAEKSDQRRLGSRFRAQAQLAGSGIELHRSRGRGRVARSFAGARAW